MRKVIGHTASAKTKLNGRHAGSDSQLLIVFIPGPEQR